jgi:hypothetical protein
MRSSVIPVCWCLYCDHHAPYAACRLRSRPGARPHPSRAAHVCGGGACYSGDEGGGTGGGNRRVLLDAHTFTPGPPLMRGGGWDGGCELGVFTRTAGSTQLPGGLMTWTTRPSRERAHGRTRHANTRNTRILHPPYTRRYTGRSRERERGAGDAPTVAAS